MLHYKTATKAKSKGSSCLGACIVGLQQTQYDGVSSVRIYGKIDQVMELLAKAMKLDVQKPNPGTCYVPTIAKKNIVAFDNDSKCILKVPYDKNGKLTQNPAKFTEWDLSKGARVKVTIGPGKGYVGTVVQRNAEGHINIRLPCQREGSEDQGKTWVLYTLGLWWLETATKGTANLLPVINTTKPAVLRG